MIHHIVLRVIAKLLVPFIVVFALYVQFHGEYGPGGGFQAGVIFAVAFILYALIYGLENARRVAPSAALRTGIALGVLTYVGTGFAGLLLGGAFLDFSVLAPTAQAGQVYGILIVEFGIGLAVAATMISIFFTFAGRKHPDEAPQPKSTNVSRAAKGSEGPKV
jgi:multicomponent Na+:H+ antiporter subunit B